MKHKWIFVLAIGFFILSVYSGFQNDWLPAGSWLLLAAGFGLMAGLTWNVKPGSVTIYRCTACDNFSPRLDGRS